MIIFATPCRKNRCGIFHATQALRSRFPVILCEMHDKRGARKRGLRADVHFSLPNSTSLCEDNCAEFNSSLWEMLYHTDADVPCLPFS